MRILYIDLDTLRPDHLGCYGYHRNTSPNIDDIATQAVRFENTYASDAPCLPSRTAMMTGRFGIHNGVVGHGGTAADLRIEGKGRGFQDCLPTDSLPGSLRSGSLQNPEFKTALISGFGTRHAIWPFYAGFHEIYDTGKGGVESAEEVTPTALKWLKDNEEEENWFLHLNYWDPHTPYRAPESFGNPFADEPLPDWITDEVLEEHWDACGPHTAQEVGMWHGDDDPKFPRHPGQVKGREGLRRLFDGYDTGIAYVDSHLGQVFSALKDQGIFEDTAIIISADHGENMGELGLYGEHGTADHPTCRIPMVVKWPGGQKGVVNRGLHYHLDLAPTLAELMGKDPRPGWDGQSYASAILEGKEEGRDYLVISQCAHVCQRGVRWGPWLYIRTYHDGFHLFPEEMLFNIEEDPYEQANLAESHRDMCKEGAYYLMEWHDKMMKTMPEGYTNDPLWTVMAEDGPHHTQIDRLESYCERLEATGRGHHIPALRRRHPKKLS